MNAPAVSLSGHPSMEGQDEFDLLNQDQQDAVQQIFQFLFSPEREFMVSGPAGTGKTHLMKFVMRHTLANYETACGLLGIKPRRFEIELTATTNKAAAVLAASTGFPTSTIHSFLNLKVKDNYATGTTEIVPTPSWQVHARKLIFIDEASMIDAKLHSFILKGTDKTCKIIYLGDHCQMAPVFEKISPVYDNPPRFAALKTPMRNAGQPALMALCNQLRDTVETLRFWPLPLIPGVIDLVDNQGAYDFIEATFTDPRPDARVLAFSNARVQEYNAHIRSLRHYPDHFVPGEVLVNNSVYQIFPSQTRNGSAKGPTRLFAIEAEIEIIDVRPAVDRIYADTNDPTSVLDIYHVTFREVGDAQAFQAAVPVNPLQYQDLVQGYARTRNWDRYFWLRNNFPDFRPKDAATVYKAQGSTYRTVFLDLANIGTCKHNDQLARMLYVGASRATDRIVLYGELPSRLVT